MIIKIIYYPKGQSLQFLARGSSSRSAANYFDEKYGSGAKGYTAGSADYFDRNSFVNEGIRSPYINPRNGGKHYWGNPTSGKFHWTDPLLYLYLLL